MVLKKNDRLLTEQCAREFFQDAVLSAVSNQRLPVCGETILYVVNLLTEFIRAEQLFKSGPEGPVLKPLALIYGDALGACSTGDRDNTLKKLGDIALFISGLYAGSLSRSLVDIDYYIAMGGSAYRCLAESGRVSRNSLALKDVFIELASRFSGFVDILAEVGEQTNLNSSSDILRLYEIWLCSGSKHAASKLHEAGINPVRTHRLTH